MFAIDGRNSICRFTRDRFRGLSPPVQSHHKSNRPHGQHALAKLFEFCFYFYHSWRLCDKTTWPTPLFEQTNLISLRWTDCLWILVLISGLFELWPDWMDPLMKLYVKNYILYTIFICLHDILNRHIFRL